MTPAIFVGDALGLDFLNSIATPVDTPVDWIKDGEGLLDWVEQARLAPPEAVVSVRTHALPGELDKVADQARHLREWFRGFVYEHKGRPLAAEDLAQLEPLNRLLERDEIFTRIAPVLADNDMSVGNEIPFQLQTARKWRTPEALLLPIGEALARFVCSEDFSHVKACEGPACTLLFVDHTRGHRRRWCSMAQCGNRAKQAAHRHRVKAHHD
ncbi:CGNR zinc finger domain-containing protein [Mesorhizobium carmichaelinearum]|uniref:CGNR zinc finger domain-containing protein n=1 Tax=Mesorhizobium carmichaelinearum TaxID=1208188 RepID=UPI000BA3BDB8|nr:CGNR zinc finger domain-containing protein [Mesorhizobium carmichaelinearum]